MAKSQGRSEGAAARRRGRSIVLAAVVVALVGITTVSSADVGASGEAGNAAPDAIDDVAVAPRAGTTVTLRGVDTDGDDLTFSVFSPSGVTLGTPSAPTCESTDGGTRLCSSTVSVTPTSRSGSFAFTVDDGPATDSGSITVSNALPSAVPDELVAGAGSVTTVVLRGVDADGDALAFDAFGPSGGSLGTVSAPACVTQFDGSSTCSATVTFTNTSGTGSFAYTVNDGLGTVSTSVGVRNPAPRAFDVELAATPEATTVLLTGIDPNGDDLAFNVFSPSGGTLGAPSPASCHTQADGSRLCTANVEFSNTSGTGSFAYSVSDGVNSAQSAAVVVGNPRPSALDADLVATPGTTAVLLRGVDPGGESLTFNAFSPSGGTLGAISEPACTVLFDGKSVCTALVDFTNTSGTGSFNYSVSDGVNSAQTASVAVRDPAPRAVDTDVVAGPGSTTVTLRGTDPNGGELSFATFSPSGGTLGTLSSAACLTQADGSSACTATVTFTNTSGTGSFGYSVADGRNSPQSATATVRDPAPAAVSGAIAGAAGPTTVTMRGIDANGDALTFTTSSPSGGTLGTSSAPTCSTVPDGSTMCTSQVTFTNSSANGSFNYTVNDGSGSNGATVTVSTVAGTPNAAPSVAPTSATVPTVGGVVTLRGSDADGDALTFSVSSPVAVTIGTVGTPTCTDTGDGASQCSADVVVTPAPGTVSGSWNGSFSYAANDGTVTSGVKTVTVNNPTPRALPGAAVIPTAGTTVTLRGTDSNGDALSFEFGSPVGVVLGAPSSPVCAANGDGSSSCTAEVAVTRAPGSLSTSWSGSFSYTVVDGTSRSAAVAVDVRNPAPEVFAETVPLPADGGLVTLRGSDPNGDPLTFSTSAPSGVTISQVGDVTCFATGDGSSACSATVTVTPASTVSGSSWSGSFGYTASDGSSNSTSAAVTVRNAAPRAMPDNIVVASEGGVARLVGLDTSGDNVTFEVTSENNVEVGPISPLGCGAVSAGATECRASANVTPTPPATLTTAWSGSFTYRVVDGTSVSPTATVDVRNASPVASDFEVAADTAGTVVHLEGTDANGDALRFEVGSASGVTVGTPDPALCGARMPPASTCTSAVRITPTAASWSFSYRVSDGLSNSQFLSVSGRNPTPSAAPLARPVPSGTSSLTLTGTDPNGDPLTFSIVSLPTDATLGDIGTPTCTERPDGTSLCTAEVPFTPGAGDTWSFTYRVSDGVSQSLVATVRAVRATGGDEPPVVGGVFQSLLAGANVITLSGTDPEGAHVTFSIATPPTEGSVGPISAPVCGGGTCTATVTYTPDDPTVDDSFTYRANDGSLDSAAATVFLNGNQAPFTNDATRVFQRDTALPLTLSGSDPEGQALTFALVTGPANGTLSAFPAPTCSFGFCTISVEYTPDAGFDGNDSLIYSVSDGIHPPAQATVSLIGNQAPTAFGQTRKITTPTTPLVLHGFDPELATLTFAASTPPTSGTVTIDGAAVCDGFGTCTQAATYTPTPGSTADDSFEFTVSDGANASPPAFVELQQNRSPNASDDRFDVIGNAPATLFALSNDFDPNGDPLTVTAFDTTGTAGGTVSCTADGTCTYTPPATYAGVETFTYTVSDGALTDTATVTIRPGAVISNGTVGIGVWGEGNLNVPGPTRTVGLRYEPTGNESTAPGCLCEGWGAGDATTGTTGHANEAGGGVVNLEPVSFTSTASSATSVVTIDDVLRVTHAYRPAPSSANLYEVAVTIENISGAPVDPRYRRVMDWDVEPTAFSEVVTLERGTAANILYTSDDGFASANPLAGPSSIMFEGEAVDSGPADHGALFDFGFDELAPGASLSFTTYYGAAGTEDGALAALQAVEAEAYSLGQPSTPDGPTLGTPNTFVFGFTGIGGGSALEPVAVAGDDVTVAEGTAVALDGSASFDPDGSITSYSWTPTGGVADPAAAVTSLATSDNGTRVQSLQVCDDSTPALCAGDSLVITTTNVAPTVVAAADASPTGGAVTISPIAAYTDPGTADTHTATIDWGDGTAIQGPFAVAGGVVVGTHTYTSNGVFTVQVCVSDDDAGSGCDSLVVTVSGIVNHAPTAFDAAFDIVRPTTPIVLRGFDAELASLAFTIASAPAGGTLTLDGAPTCDGLGACTVTATYTPHAGADGDDSFTFTVSDGTSTSAAATVSLVDDRVPTAFGQTRKIVVPTTALVLRGFDPELATLTFAISTSPTSGTVSLDGSAVCDGFGSCTQAATYTPASGSTADDSFEFTVSDGSNTSTPALVELQQNGAPVASDDRFDVIGNEPATLLPLGNDLDSDGDLLTITAFDTTGTAGGTVDCVLDGTCTYTPPAVYVGVESFTYTVSDGVLTDTATVTIRPGAIVTNGTVSVGVWGEGNLNVPGPTRTVGLRYEPTGNESTAPGCLCEGWGAADADSGTTGHANEASGGIVNLDPVSFTSDASTATSVVTIDGVLRVTHAYRPAPSSANLYEVAVTVENISAAPVDPRYRRVMDWDVEPTAFSEFVTLERGTAANILYTSDDGFATANPLAGPSSIAFEGEAVDSGPDDHGALFDFGFDTLAPGGSLAFTTYYGAAGTEDGALDALQAVEAEAYSLGQPSTPDGPTLGTPNTFVFGFTGIGGESAFEPIAVTGADITLAEGAVVALDGSGSFDPDGTITSYSWTPTGGVADPTAAVTSLTTDDNGTRVQTLEVCDNSTPALCASDSLVITTTNVAPTVVATDDTTSTGGAVTISPIAAYTDPGTADTHTATIDWGDGSAVRGPFAVAGGVVVGTHTYTSNGVFTVQVCVADDDAGSSCDTLLTTVTGIDDNRPPTADDVTVATDEDVSVDLIVDATDLDGDTLTVTELTAPTIGIVAPNGPVACTDGNCTIGLRYTPHPNANGSDSFTVTVSDGNGGTDTATVSVTVRPVDDPPTAGAITTSTDEDTAVDMTLFGVDVDGDTLTFAVGTAPTHGTVTCVAASCTYTPAANFHGADSLTYLVTAAGRTATGSVSINVSPVGDAPVGVDDSASTPEDTAVAIDVGANDTDVDGDALTMLTVTAPTSGTAAVGPGQQVTYTPAADFCGADSFSYTIGDPAQTDTAVVTVTVECVNDPPVANPDAATVAAAGTVAVNVLANDTDVEGDTLSGAGSGTTAAGGTYVCGTPACSYTAAPGASGTDTFTYTLSDGNGGTATGTVTISIENAAPVADDVAVTTDEDVSVEVTLTASDANGDPLVFVVATAPTFGTVTCIAAACTYTPAADTSGVDSFTFTVSDGHGGSTTGAVTITVRPVNDVPVITGSGPVSRPEGSTAPLGVTVSDVDSTAFTYLWSPISGLDDPTLRTPTFSAVDDGTFPFGVMVCDTGVPVACASLADAATVTVTNVVPAVDAISGIDATTGVSLTQSLASFTDAGVADTHTATIDWGDGTAVEGPSAVTGAVSGAHSYASAGTFTIRVCVTDDDGGTRCDTTVARVTNPSTLPALSVSDASVVEGDSGSTTMTFTVSLAAPAAPTVRVGWSTSPGTATPGTDPLAHPEDYRSASGTATIRAGSVTTEVRIRIAGDLVAEAGETFFVTLTAPVNAAIGDGQGVGTIEADDDVCTVVGTSGADVLTGTDGADVLCGLGGNDTYDPRGGDDTVIDTGGIDRLTYELAPNGVVVDLAAGTATGWGNDVFASIEHAVGSAHDDVLSGSSVVNELNGLSGADRLSGHGGNDTLLGGDGDDQASGGLGSDLVMAGDGEDTVFGDAGSDVVFGGEDADVLDGGEGADILLGGEDDDRLVGGAGTDTLIGDEGDDELLGGDGRDTLDGGDGVDVLLGGAANDTLAGGDGDDTVEGGAGNDALSGDGGDDVLRGDEGNDVLDGGDGDDVLVGGPGTDQLDGGPGDDTETP